MGYSLKTYSVIISRALYALNWFDIAPGLVYISSDLNLRVVDLGIITTFFYLGLAIFQLVGGAMASRIGAKKVAFLGLMILGLGGIFSGISTTFPELAAARFLAGTGSALFFSPGLTVLREVSPPETYSFQVGLYNGAFNLGG
ncbi:MAG: MFS transporter, partial [Thermoplasmatales archaeon]